MSIEATLEKPISRRNFLSRAKDLVIAGTIGNFLSSPLNAESDFYRQAYSAWKTNNHQYALDILNRGSRSANNRQAAECMHFLGFIAENDGETGRARDLYRQAFTVADMSGGYVDDVFDHQALRADFIAEGARVVDEAPGREGFVIKTRHGESDFFTAKDWSHYYHENKDVKDKLRDLFRNSNLASQKSIHGFFMNPENNQIHRINVYSDGFLGIESKKDYWPNQGFAILFKVESRLKSEIRAL